MLSRLLKLSISINFYIVCKSIRAILALFKKKIPGTLVVLTYHSIKPNQRFAFEKHLDCLGKTGRPVFADVSAPLSSRQHHQAVTFDDGFQSVLENALPAMHKRKIPATIFITTGYLGKKPGWLLETNHKDADEILMTEAQLRQLPTDLVAIGSHCVTHRNLTHLDGPAAKSEIKDSKKILESILNRPVDILSFPHGACTEKIIDLCKKAGYQRVFVNLPTAPVLRIEDYVLGRISVSLQDWQIEYRLKFMGAYQWLPYAVKMKRYLLNLRHLFLRRNQRKSLSEC
jgi:peptidoglycan/xylan/chitin deacetylase (PgdA/CDA1 family)